MMDHERFKAIVEAYGAAPTRWPAAERASAEAFAREDGRASALLAEAAAIDAGLDSVLSPVDSTLSTARALRRFDRQSAVNTLASPSSRSFWALAASALIGLALGVGASTATPSGADPEQLLTTAFQSPFDVAGEDFGG